MNFRYPIFLDVAGKRCLVTGEGYEIAGKISGLAQAGAEVLYVNPDAVSEIRAKAEAGAIQWHAREFETGDLDGCFLVITCGRRNAEIFELAESRRILCNAVDDPKHCRYSYGSKVARGDLSIAISTNGIAPALAVRLKERLKGEIGPEYGEFLELLRALRPKIISGITDFERRRNLWYRLVDSDVLQLFKKGDADGARRLAHELIQAELEQ